MTCERHEPDRRLDGRLLRSERTNSATDAFVAANAGQGVSSKRAHAHGSPATTHTLWNYSSKPIRPQTKAEPATGLRPSCRRCSSRGQVQATSADTAHLAAPTGLPADHHASEWQMTPPHPNPCSARRPRSSHPSSRLACRKAGGVRRRRRAPLQPTRGSDPHRSVPTLSLIHI